MAKETDALDKAIEAFKTYQSKGRLDVKARIERIKALQEAMKLEGARIRPTTK